MRKLAFSSSLSGSPRSRLREKVPPDKVERYIGASATLCLHGLQGPGLHCPSSGMMEERIFLSGGFSKIKSEEKVTNLCQKKRLSVEKPRQLTNNNQP